MSTRRVTALDVAKLAGVSRSTVSYILNGSNRQTFPPATVERVKAAAAQLSYSPDAAARALRRGESGIVMLAVSRTIPPGLGQLQAMLTDAVRATNRSLVTWTIRPGNTLADALRDITPRAILALTPLSDPDQQAADAAQIPVVSVGKAMADLDGEMGRQQVGHLAELGHHRLAVLTIADPAVEPHAAARMGGVTSRARALGLRPPRVLAIGAIHSGTAAEVATTLRSWTADPHEPVTGLCCLNDLVATIALTAAEIAGLSVPRDLSVVGADDDYLATLSRPRLTSVRCDFAGMADRVRWRLAEELDGRPAELTAQTDLHVVARESSGPAFAGEPH